MQKETVLAKLHVSMKYSKSTLKWFDKVKDQQLWFAMEGGINYFSEFRSRWEKSLIESCEPIVYKYFTKFDLPQDKLPRIVVYESYPGSWIMEAAIIMFASVGTAYTILKGVSELPKIADGLTELKDRLQKEFSELTNRHITEDFKSSVKKHDIPPPPHDPIVTDFVIDARPLLALTPSAMKSHKIHLSVAISRDAFTLENLGDEAIRNVQIGLFKSDSHRNQWSYADAFTGSISILSPHQTITKDISDFRHTSGSILNLDDDHPLHIDCWVQDTHGIYLFMFYLED